MTHSRLSNLNKVIEIFAQDLVLRRKSSESVRLTPAELMRISQYFDEVCDSPGRLPWFERLRAVRESRYISFDQTGNTADISTVLFAKLVEEQHQIVFVESKSKCSSTFQKFSSIFSVLGIQVEIGRAGSICLEQYNQTDVVLKIATIPELIDDIYMQLNSNIFRKPILVFNSSSTLSNIDSGGFIPYYFNDPARGVSANDWTWLGRLSNAWMHKSDASWFCETRTIAENIESLIESNESFKNPKLAPLIRFSSWMIANALDTMNDAHEFCQFSPAGRIQISIPEQMKSKMPSVPLQHFMAILLKAELGRKMTHDRISCQMPIATVHIQNILDFYSYKFCWIGMQPNKSGVNWVPKCGPVSVRRIKNSPYRTFMPKLDFRVFHGDSAVENYLDSLQKNEFLIFTDNPLYPVYADEISALDNLEQPTKSKHIIFLGVPRTLNLFSIVSMFRLAASITFLFDKSFESNRLSDAGYEKMNHLLIKVGLIQSNSKRIESALSDLFDYLNLSGVSSLDIQSELEFLVQARNEPATGKISMSHKNYSLMNAIRELQPRLLRGLGSVVRLDNIKISS